MGRYLQILGALFINLETLIQAQAIFPGNLNPCRKGTCQNGGTCIAPMDYPECLCATGFHDDQVDLASLCFLTDCPPDRYCRAALPCARCQPVATCVPLSTVGEGLDLACQRQNYFQVLLIQSVNIPDTYNRLRCRRHLSVRDCPKGSVCVDDMTGGGVCCFGKASVVEKPGTCPNIKRRYQSLCIGALCQTDEHCPNTLKCCDSSCGTKICTDVAGEQLTCPGGCATGYICEYRPYPCPPGQFCIQIVIPTCVPLTDDCGGCPSGQECQFIRPPCPPPPGCDTPDRSGCIRPFCIPVPRCVPSITTPKPVDPCGGCPNGHVCIDTGLRCVTTPCPSYQCVTNNSCGGCPPGQSCHEFFPGCLPPRNCDVLDPSVPCLVSECKPIIHCLPDTITPVDVCGGCPKGQTCRFTGIVCKKASCPSYACFDQDD